MTMQKPCTVGRNQLKIGRILRASKKFVKMLWFSTCWLLPYSIWREKWQRNIWSEKCVKTQGFNTLVENEPSSTHWILDNTGNVENEEKFVATFDCCCCFSETTSWFCFSLYNYIAFGGFELCYTFVIVLERRFLIVGMTLASRNDQWWWSQN